MAENLMSKGHKTTTDKYRDGWDRIFKKVKRVKVNRRAKKKTS